MACISSSFQAQSRAWRISSRSSRRERHRSPAGGRSSTRGSRRRRSPRAPGPAGTASDHLPARPAGVPPADRRQLALELVVDGPHRLSSAVWLGRPPGRLLNRNAATPATARPPKPPFGTRTISGATPGRRAGHFGTVSCMETDTTARQHPRAPRLLSRTRSCRQRAAFHPRSPPPVGPEALAEPRVFDSCARRPKNAPRIASAPWGDLVTSVRRALTSSRKSGPAGRPAVASGPVSSPRSPSRKMPHNRVAPGVDRNTPKARKPASGPPGVRNGHVTPPASELGVPVRRRLLR